MTELAEPLVSVCMITYNHEKYIAQAIESVLMQRTSFKYELVIGEDCSTDSTREIVREYALKFPEIIRTLFHDENLGLMGKGNLVKVYKACLGKYVALLEGDDYWTDPYKLQKQANFLDSHSKYVVCFHNVLVTYEDIDRGAHLREKIAWDTYSIEDIIRTNNYINSGNATPGHTSSVVFRNFLFSNFPPWFYDSYSGDIPLFILLGNHGLAKYLDEAMGVHRIHSAGASRQLLWANLYRDQLNMYESINRHLGFQYNRLIRSIISRIYVRIALLHKQQGEINLFTDVLIKSTLRDLKTPIYYFETSNLYKEYSYLLRKIMYVLKNDGFIVLLKLFYNFMKSQIEMYKVE